MPIDPHGLGQPQPGDSGLWQKIADLERQLNDLRTGQGGRSAVHASRSNTISTTSTADHALDLSLDCQLYVPPLAAVFVFARIWMQAPGGGFALVRLQVDAGGDQGTEGDFIITNNTLGITIMPGFTSTGSSQSFGGGMPRAFGEIPAGLRTFKAWGKSTTGGTATFKERDLWVWTLT